jgi:hypothetical protein
MLAQKVNVSTKCFIKIYLGLFAYFQLQLGHLQIQVLKFINDLDGCLLHGNLEQVLQKLVGNDRITVLLSTDLLDNCDAAIRLCNVSFVSNKCIVEVKISILLQLYALNAIYPLQKTIAVAYFL